MGALRKFLAPTSVWCNWFAWSPVLAIGSGLGAGYILSLFFAPDAAINTWQVTLLDLGAVKEGLTLRINATFFIGLVLMLACFSSSTAASSVRRARPCSWAWSRCCPSC